MIDRLHNRIIVRIIQGVLCAFFIITTSCQDKSTIYSEDEIIQLVKNDLKFYRPNYALKSSSIKLRKLEDGKYHIKYQGRFPPWATTHYGLIEFEVVGKGKYKVKTLEGIGYDLNSNK